MLSKWEKYEAHGINPEGGSWRLTFKLFAFYDPIAPDLTSTEKVRVCVCVRVLVCAHVYGFFFLLFFCLFARKGSFLAAEGASAYAVEMRLGPVEHDVLTAPSSHFYSDCRSSCLSKRLRM